MGFVQRERESTGELFEFLMAHGIPKVCDGHGPAAGATALRFTALCDSEGSWEQPTETKENFLIGRYGRGRWVARGSSQRARSVCLFVPFWYLFPDRTFVRQQSQNIYETIQK